VRPDERARIFESFYRHNDELIGRLSRGQLGRVDIKVLARGAPTVPFPPAFRAAMSW
jgi:hypothetical protein